MLRIIVFVSSCFGLSQCMRRRCMCKGWYQFKAGEEGVHDQPWKNIIGENHHSSPWPLFQKSWSFGSNISRMFQSGKEILGSTQIQTPPPSAQGHPSRTLDQPAGTPCEVKETWWPDGVQNLNSWQSIGFTTEKIPPWWFEMFSFLEYNQKWWFLIDSKVQFCNEENWGDRVVFPPYF